MLCNVVAVVSDAIIVTHLQKVSAVVIGLL